LGDQFYAAVAAKNEHDYLEAEITTAKTKHADALAAKDAEIAALEAELAAHRA
jgi:hypothetical protein